MDRHHDLLQRRVTRALAEAIDGAFNLPDAGLHCGQRVCYGHAKIIVAMNGENQTGHFHVLDEIGNQFGIFIGNRVTYGVGDV